MANVNVIPCEDFTGYPNGKKVEFKTGVPVEVPEKYAELLKQKGHLKGNQSVSSVSKTPL